MKEFLNEDKKQFMDCSGEEMKALVNAGHDCNCEFFIWDGWFKKTSSEWYNRNIYRTKPVEKRMPAYPWHVLSGLIVACTTDKNGHVRAHTKRPEPCERDWVCSGTTIVLPTAIEFDRGNVNWRDSLQMRPSVEAEQEPVEWREPKVEDVMSWMPVNKELPNDQCGVLVTRHPTPDELEKDREYHSVIMAAIDEDSGDWYEFDTGKVIDTKRWVITHWMPLPEPPKNQDSEMIKRWEPEGGDWYVDHYGEVSNCDSAPGTKMFGVEFETKEQAEQAAKDFRLFHLMYQAWREIEGWDAYFDVYDVRFEMSNKKNEDKYKLMIASWVEELG